MSQNQIADLTLIYNSDKNDDKQARSYVASLQGFTIRTIDLASESITETQLTDIAAKLNCAIEDLLDPAYDDHISVHTEGLKIMDRQSLLSLMTDDTKLINTPIAIIGKQAFKFGSGGGFREIMAREVSGKFNHHDENFGVESSVNND